MAHLATHSGYQDLVARLNRFPQGAPPSRLLDRILSLLVSEREAGLVSLLPIAPFTAKVAARRWKTNEVEALAVLEPLAARGFLLDIEDRGRRVFVLPPPMAGFFEFSMMRVRGDVDQKELAELFYQYLNVEEDFIKALFAGGESGLGRVFVNEEVLSGEESLRVLDHEKASEVVAMGVRVEKRLAASRASQQQPQQLQMKLTSWRTFSPNCTRLCSMASFSSASPSLASTRRAMPCLMSDCAAPANVMQIRMGALHALPRCCIL